MFAPLAKDAEGLFTFRERRGTDEIGQAMASNPPRIRQLSSSATSEVASSEVSAVAEVKFAPLAAQVNDSLGRT